MFESSFEKIGRFSERNSGKIIIFWVVLLIVLLPFASLLFSLTSYDIGGSITPSNSMANIADNLQSTYFVGNGSSGSNDSIVIVTTGTSVNNQSTVNDLISIQSGVSQSLPGISSNFTSIFGIENSTLSGVASFSSAVTNGTYPLIQQINNQSMQLNASLNATYNMIFGIPALYLQSYLTSSHNASQAYQSASALAEGNFVSMAYLNGFSYYINSIIALDPSLTISNVSSAINDTVMSYNSPFVLKMVQLNQNVTLFISTSILGNFTFSAFPASHTEIDQFAYNFTVPFLASQLGANATLVSFLSDQLNITATKLVSDAFNLSIFPTAPEITALTDRLVANGAISYFRGSPFISINPHEILNFVTNVNSSGNPNLTAYQTLIQGDFSIYPAVPAPYVFHQFVGYDNSTVITILTTSRNLTGGEISNIEEVYATHTANLPSSNYYVAGSSALSSQLASESLGGMIRALAIGIVLSVIIVGVFFRSPVAAFLPLLIFGFSAAISISVNALIYKYVLHSTISFITPTLLLILILGLSSDYVVYIMARYRRELAKGNPDASAVSSKWAGHAVFTSGITVSLSYVVLWLSGVPIFSDSGITNAVGVVITIIAANTLLLAILSRSKEKVFWPSKVNNKPLPADGGMAKVADFVIKNKGKIVILFIVVSLFSGYLYTVTPSNMDVFNLVPQSGGIQAIKAVNSSFNGDFFDRGFVILQFSSPVKVGNSYNITEINAITAVENKLLSSSDVTQVYGPTFPYGEYVAVNLTSIPQRYQSAYLTQIGSYIGNDSRYVQIDFQLSALAWLNQPSSFVKTIPTLIADSGSSATYNVYVGGTTQSLNDAYSFTLKSFLDMVPILSIAIFAVLLIQISSLFTPIRLILMVFASVLISLSIAFLILYYYLGLPILIFLPMFTVITLLAVGLDYDIFMVTRVREEAFKGNNDEEGIRTSIRENGGVIITLGTLLFATFGSLAFSGIGIIQEIGIGLSLGVLIDTFVSWPFFVPAVMLYLQKYNWWPTKFDRVQKK